MLSNRLYIVQKQIDSGNLQEACHTLNEMSHNFPAYSPLFVLLADTCEKLGQPRQALTAWKHVQFLIPDAADAQRRIDALNTNIATFQVEAPQQFSLNDQLDPFNPKLSIAESLGLSSDKQRYYLEPEGVAPALAHLPSLDRLIRDIEPASIEPVKIDSIEKVSLEDVTQPIEASVEEKEEVREEEAVPVWNMVISEEDQEIENQEITGDPEINEKIDFILESSSEVLDSHSDDIAEPDTIERFLHTLEESHETPHVPLFKEDEAVEIVSEEIVSEEVVEEEAIAEEVVAEEAIAEEVVPEEVVAEEIISAEAIEEEAIPEEVAPVNFVESNELVSDELIADETSMELTAHTDHAPFDRNDIEDFVEAGDFEEAIAHPEVNKKPEDTDVILEDTDVIVEDTDATPETLAVEVEAPDFPQWNKPLSEVNFEVDINFDWDKPAVLNPAESYNEVSWQTLQFTLEQYAPPVETVQLKPEIPAPIGFDNLDDLIMQLENAPRIVPRTDNLDEELHEPEEGEIEDMVSETLAKIYANQSQFSDAAQVYDKLAVQHPERAAYFLAKAVEMRAK